MDQESFINTLLYPISESYKRIEHWVHTTTLDAQSSGSILLHICQSEDIPYVWENSFKLLLQEGADANYQDHLGCSLLTHAVHKEHLNLVQLLLEHKARPYALDEHGISCFEIVLERMGPVDEDIARALLAHGINPKDVDRFDRPWLNLICEKPEASALAFELLHAGADPDIQDPGGNNALTCAARAGNAAGISLLLSEGANPRLLGPGGLTALDIALGARHPPRKPGMSKVEEGHMRCALRLLKVTGAHHVDAQGLSPLIRLWRSTLRFEPIWMEQLLAAGALINATDDDGNTLLHWLSVGAPQSAFNMCKWALAKGADASIKNHQNMLPYECALERQCYPAAYLLQSAHEHQHFNAHLNSQIGFIPPDPRYATHHGDSEHSSSGTKRL